MKVSWTWTAALVVAVCLWGAAAPAAAECNDRWQQAQKLYDQAKALYDQRKYSEASEAFETAALAWQRAADDCLRTQADTAKADAAKADAATANYQSSVKNSQLMVCLKNYDAAQAVADRARELSAQGNWLEAEKAYDQAKQNWLNVAKGCDQINANRAKRNAQEAGKNAKTASDNYLSEKSRGR